MLVILARDIYVVLVSTYLQTSHDTGILNTPNGLPRNHTSEVRVVACTFPVSAAGGQASQRADDRTKGDMDALFPEFMAHAIGAIVGQSPIPASAHVNTAWEAGDEVGVAYAVFRHLEDTYPRTQDAQSGG